MAITYVPIQTVTVSSTTTSLTFSSIPQIYTDLVLKASVRSTAAAGGITFYTYPNANTTGSYYFCYFGMDYTPAKRGWKGAGAWTGMSNSSAASANSFSNVEVTYLNYSYSGSRVKLALSKHGTGSAETNQPYLVIGGRYWDGTAAITSLQVDAESGFPFAAGSTFYLYGIKNA